MNFGTEFREAILENASTLPYLFDSVFCHDRLGLQDGHPINVTIFMESYTSFVNLFDHNSDTALEAFDNIIVHNGATMTEGIFNQHMLNSLEEVV